VGGARWAVKVKDVKNVQNVLNEKNEKNKKHKNQFAFALFRGESRLGSS
jgi:hypothetical protein